MWVDCESKACMALQVYVTLAPRESIPLRCTVMCKRFRGLQCCLPDVLGPLRYTADGPGARSDLEGDAETSACGGAGYMFVNILQSDASYRTLIGCCDRTSSTETERQYRSFLRLGKVFLETYSFQLAICCVPC